MIGAAVVAFGMLAVAAVLCIIGMWRAAALAGAVVAVDLLLLVVVLGIGVHIAATADTTFVGLMLVTSLVGFAGTAAVARFVERSEPPS